MTTLDEKLGGLSKRELIRLIHRLIEQDPDLKLIVDMAAHAPAETVDVQKISKKIERTFDVAGYGWGASLAVSELLEPIVSIGRDFLERKRWADGLEVIRTLVDEVLERYETLNDEGEVATIVTRSLGLLESSLPEIRDPDVRRRVLRTLFDAFAWDVGFGGIDIGGDPAVIRKHADADERALVAGWVREKIPPGDPLVDDDFNWKRRAFGSYLLNVLEDDLDREAYLQIARETGLWETLIETLLKLGRTDEAVEATKPLSDYDVERLTYVYDEFGITERLEPIVRERLAEARGLRFHAWLIRASEKRGAYEDALEFAREVFLSSETEQEYEDMKRLAMQVGRWPEVRAAIEAHFADAERYDVLTQIHLFEGEVASAVAMLRKAADVPRWDIDRLALSVAHAAEAELPSEAASIYMVAALRLINRRGRSNYREAAAHLVRVRDLCMGMGRPSDWTTRIETLRAEHKNLPALKDELRKVGIS